MILILGGTKSGKTSFAEKTADEIARSTGRNVVYLATAQAWDDEMKLRIRRHQDSRPAEWITLEEPLDMEAALQRKVCREGNVILMDCLTLWVTNILMTLGEDFRQEEAEDTVLSRLEVFLEKIDGCPGEFLIVSNQVENGLVSPNFLGRIFQEIAGRCHQIIAARADQVYLVTAGLPQPLK